MRLAPIRSPGFLGGFAVTAASVGGAFLLYLVVAGISTGISPTQAFFPALIVATLYGGWRWGAVCIAAGAAVTWWRWVGGTGQALTALQQGALILYLLAAALTAAAAEALRVTIIRLDEATRARTNAEQALTASETRLQLAQAAVGLGVWEWNLATSEIHWSSGFRRNVGIGPTETPSFEGFLAHIDEADRERVRHGVLSAIEKGGVYEIEYRLTQPAGSGERWLHSRGEVTDDPETGRRLIGVNFDVTDRRAAEAGLRESEARFRALADSAPALMWVSRLGGRREFVNRAYVEFAAMDFEAALDLDWRDVLHPDDLPRILNEQVAGEGSMKPFSLEARYRRADGEWRWLKSYSQPRYGPGGEFIGFIGIGFDITEAKQAQLQLAQVNLSLTERTEVALAERDAAQAALIQAQKLEAVGQLTGGVAHDFNNLLTVVIGALDIVLKHPEDARRRERLVEAAMSAARRGERLTQQLLAFSRRQPLRPEVLNADALITELEPLLRRAIGEAVALELAMDAESCAARIDASQFEAALLNLAVNARDAAPSGRITISTECLKEPPIGGLPAGPYLKISVHDDGQGMDAETAARVFEPFFTTKPVGKGTGLGLSQVYGFAKQSGGGVTIDSAPGEGATVSLLLPMVSEPVRVVETSATPDTPRPQASLTVLLVEDDHDVGELVETMLAELGHTVIRADHVDAALHVAASTPEVGLVITDVIMPGGASGVDLARALAEQRPDLPVVLSSGYTGETLALAEAAPWPLLRKPYALDALAAAISQAMEKSQPASASA
ncbi:PAS domain-containing protein [Caulobacter segnis]|uniref:hybrid sensor histidine kinase/response regulator n=1 Tax=Caulobacter segnis TaxID=88688 RepID=UPI00240F38DF|nr:PAS domain-containing sensor histidine kinase [Caulobacter segnis]MDG2522838.1 PAS domain-containing protein [Caulobacter segnis]